MVLLACALPFQRDEEHATCDVARRKWGGVRVVLGASIGTLVDAGRNHDLADDESPFWWERDADDRGVAPLQAALLRPEGGGAALGFALMPTLGPVVTLGSEFSVDLGSYRLQHAFALRLAPAIR